MAEIDEMRQQIQELIGALNAMTAQNQENQRQIAQLNNQIGNRGADPFKIPDPIKSIPSYDGNRKQLSSWLHTVETTLGIFNGVATPQQERMYFQAIMNKLEGKARDIVCLSGTIGTLAEMREILTNALGDKQELSTYKSQLWQNRMLENTNIHEYYSKTKEIVQNIKTLSKQKALFNRYWEAIEAFIEEDALAAFIAGLKKPYFGYAQAARPKNLEEAYAFVCSFTSTEKTSANMGHFKQPKNNYKRPDRESKGNYRSDFRKDHKSDPSGPNEKRPMRNDSEEPMDIDKSLRSRVTLNRKLVNNHECEDSTDEENEEISVNFWQAPQQKEVT